MPKFGQRCTDVEGRDLQPEGEVSLQTGCRYSDGQSATQFMIAVCGGHRPGFRVPA